MEQLIIFIIMLMLGYGFGTVAERRHYASIKKREGELKKMLLIASKKVPKNLLIKNSELVAGSVVVSVDYFKQFAASLRNLVGGRVTSFESLLDRGRREAILRMKEEAKDKGATAVFNVKIETSSISKGQKNRIGSIEVLAYGTAIVTQGNKD